MFLFHQIGVEPKTLQSKVDRTLMYPGQVDEEIWNVLSNNSKNRASIIVRDLTDSGHQLECERFINFSLDLVNNKFDRRAIFSRLSKTTTGYTVTLSCSKNSAGSCSIPWYIRYDATTNEVNATCYKTCDHLFSTQPSKLNDF